MARTIAIDIPHQLDLAEARRRAVDGITGLARKLPGGGEVTSRWPSENDLRLDIMSMGRAIVARVQFEERLIRVSLSLPLMLAVISGTITAKVRHAIEALLHGGEPVAPAAADVRPSAPAGQRLPLFQYWDAPPPPPDVAGWIAGFRRDNPGLKHVLMDTERAAAYIAKHHGARARTAFDACRHPAMQADYFRLCAMAATGGLYLDADMQSLRPLMPLLDTAPDALMVVWKGLINNSILLFRQPHHSFVRACLALATRIIEARLFHSVAIATGPGVFNAIRYLADPDFRALVIDLFGHGWEDIAALIGDTSDPAIAAQVEGLLDRAAWEDLKMLARLADEIAPDFPTLAADFSAITLIGTADSMAWIGQEQAEYQKAGDRWLFGDRNIYR